MHSKKPIASRSKRRPIIAVVIILLLAGIAAGAWWSWDQRKDNASKDSRPTSQRGEDNIDYSPATEEEKKENEQHKDELIIDEGEPTTPPSGNVTPVISDAGKYGTDIEVSAFVPSIIEEGGTCTMKAVLDNHTVTKQTTSLRNAQNTSCPAFIVPRSEFPAAGTWTITVSYSSATYNGTSEARKLAIQ